MKGLKKTEDASVVQSWDECAVGDQALAGAIQSPSIRIQKVTPAMNGAHYENGGFSGLTKTKMAYPKSKHGLYQPVLSLVDFIQAWYRSKSIHNDEAWPRAIYPSELSKDTTAPELGTASSTRSHQTPHKTEVVTAAPPGYLKRQFAVTDNDSLAQTEHDSSFPDLSPDLALLLVDPAAKEGKNDLIS
ncbi:hypothetical protein FRB94_003808 [Tulasnella sp. JGI-2019a]|nr:hypothetical protein FRB94_003808 [Tulasnella sp. JGI-2019a]KAG8993923.1 hypothetical protein FRB93_001862 [Tulasnella sp. JGI-2019a]KAG9033842.1 hypothetical protein FRB95_014164 [Tulasnella sp. JGI-2019a]